MASEPLQFSGIGSRPARAAFSAADRVRVASGCSRTIGRGRQRNRHRSHLRLRGRHSYGTVMPETAAATLAELRREIDRIDETMHRLLMERGEIIDRLIAVKRTSDRSSAFR